MGSQLRLFRNIHRIPAFRPSFNRIIHQVTFFDRIGRLVNMEKHLFTISLNDKTKTFGAVKIVDLPFF